jgi:hypothetical protein
MKKEPSGGITYILNVNQKYLAGEKTENPVEYIPVLDGSSNIEYISDLQKRVGKEALYEYMLSTDDLVSLLKIPIVSKETLNAFWSKESKDALDKVRTDSGFDFGKMGDFLKMNDGTHEDIRIVKVITKNRDGKPESLVILDSPSCKETWVVMEKNNQIDNVHSIKKRFPDGKKYDEELHLVSKEGIPEMLLDIKKILKGDKAEEITNIAEAINMLNKNGSPEAPFEPEIAINDAISTKKGIIINGAKIPLRNINQEEAEPQI